MIYRLVQSNAETGTAQNGSVFLCFKNTPIVVNGFNTLQAVSDGATHTFYLNGTLVCSTNDATYTSGPVVLSAFVPCPSGSPPYPRCTATAGHQLQVDSISIKSLETAPAAVTGAEVMDPMAFAATASQVATGSFSQGQVGSAVAASR